jgi:hypothetical protein
MVGLFGLGQNYVCAQSRLAIPSGVGEMIISAEIFDANFRALNIYEQGLFMYLAIRTNERTGLCNPTHSTIMTDLDMGKNTLLNSMHHLVAAGFITRHPGKGRYLSTQYSIGLPGKPIKTKSIGLPEAPIKTVNRFAAQTSIGLPGNTLKKNIIRTPPGFAPDSFEYRLATKLWESITEEGTSQKKPDLQAWARTFDQTHRIDGHSYHWILLTLQSARADDFWKKNIRSPEALRKQINAGKLDIFTPKIGAAMTDDELFAHEKQKATAA